MLAAAGGAIAAILMVSGVINVREDGATGGAASRSRTAGQQSEPGVASGVSSISRFITLNDAPPGISADAVLKIVEHPSGRVVGEINVLPHGWVLLRKTANQLLVSDFGLTEPRLFVVDIQSPAAAKANIDMPNRIASTGYAPGMVLSEDERYLYYLKLENQCPSGGNAAQCDVYSVGTVDLQGYKEIAHSSLPTNCGYAGMAPLGASDVIALCPNIATLVKVTPEGSSSVAATFPVRDTGSDEAVFPIAGASLANGNFFLVYSDGVVLVSGEERPLTNLLPSSEFRLQLQETYRWQLDAHTGVFAYSRQPEGEIAGLIVMSLDDPRSHQDIRLPEGIDHVAPAGGHAFALLDRDNGTISTLDVATGALEKERAAIIPGAKWLISQ
jgi:hypothetical protein